MSRRDRARAGGTLEAFRLRKKGLVINAALMTTFVACQQSPGNVSDAPQTPGVHQDTIDSEQSETAVATSLSFPFPTVVAAFNDFSSNTVGAPEIDYSVTPHVYRKGVSLLGWGNSVDSGQTWAYMGKIRPPTGWSTIMGDPSAATDPNTPSTTYLAELGVSDTSWNSASDGSLTMTTYPATLVDSVCVGESDDGGQTYPSVGCVQVNSSSGSVDRTALTVDGSGRVWFATSDTTSNPFHVRVYRSKGVGVLSGFDEVTPDSAGSVEPRLVTDNNGDIWLGAIFSFSGIGVQRFKQAASGWDDFVNVTGTCNIPLSAQDSPIPIGASGFLRNAHTYDFVVGLDEAQQFVLRGVFQVPRDDSRRFIQAAEVNTTGCSASSEFSTSGDAGQQFQPSLSYQNRDGTPTWWIQYLTTSGVPDPTQNYVHPEAGRLTRAFGSLLIVQRTELTPNTWYPCPISSENYWGDYTGLSQVRDTAGTWWTVGAYSDSSPAPPCNTSSTGSISGPIHVSASRW